MMGGVRKPPVKVAQPVAVSEVREPPTGKKKPTELKTN
jgi:hypothetical protein